MSFQTVSIHFVLILILQPQVYTIQNNDIILSNTVLERKNSPRQCNICSYEANFNICKVARFSKIV